MRYLLILLLSAFIFLSPAAYAQGAVIVIIDGMGSSYLEGHSATYASGASAGTIDLRSFDLADTQYQLQVPVPATEYGHAVIVTGYSNISPEDVSNYHATIFDALHDDGYLALGILENGDSKAMLGELDAVVREKNDSIYNPNFEYIQNSNVPQDIVDMMREYSRLSKTKVGKDPYAPYIRYNSWALDFTTDMVAFMNTSEPQLDYVLIVNAGGLDSAGQNLGYDGYRAVLTGMDSDLVTLTETCRRTGTVLFITADHGMSFPDGTNKGSHHSAMAAGRKESLLVPLLIYSNVTSKSSDIYGQECLAPTLLSLLDEPDTLTMSDGEPLPVKDRPTIFLRSVIPVNVSISGPGLNVSIEFNGTYKVSGLEKGDYLIEHDGKPVTVRLDHDVVVDIRKDGQGAPPLPSWIAYGPATLVSIAGIAIALKLAWARR